MPLPPERSPYDTACRVLDARAERARLFRPGIFTDPAWDMLLALYCAAGKGERLSVTALCRATNVSQTTALRKMQRLLDLKIIEASSHATDGRSRLVQLSSQTQASLTVYFERLNSQLVLCPACSGKLAGS